MDGRTDTELIPIPTAWTDEDERGGAAVVAYATIAFTSALSGGVVGFILGLLLA